MLNVRDSNLCLFCPLDAVAHLLLDLVDSLERVHALVKQEGGVVHQHVDELYKLFAAPEQKTDQIVT